jgi:hypothetical protein
MLIRSKPSLLTKMQFQNRNPGPGEKHGDQQEEDTEGESISGH